MGGSRERRQVCVEASRAEEPQKNRSRSVVLFFYARLHAFVSLGSLCLKQVASLIGNVGRESTDQEETGRSKKKKKK